MHQIKRLNTRATGTPCDANLTSSSANNALSAKDGDIQRSSLL
jgi:hypothetical protein